MKLQIALDDISYLGAKSLLEKIKDYVDIIELGTPFAFFNPISVIGELKSLYPQQKILADFKILDGGEYMGNLAYDAGADITTVSALAHEETIAGVVRAAYQRGREVLVDMMAVDFDDIKLKTIKAEQFGAHYVCVHTSLDVKEVVDPLKSIRMAKEAARDIKVAVAGGVRLSTLPGILALNPDLIIVGGAIIKAENPKEMAAEIKSMMDMASQ